MTVDYLMVLIVYFFLLGRVGAEELFLEQQGRRRNFEQGLPGQGNIFVSLMNTHRVRFKSMSQAFKHTGQIKC